MKTLRLLLVGAFLAASQNLSAATNSPPSLASRAGGPRVLIVTGIDYPGHLWKQTAPALRQVLEEGGFSVRVVEDPEALASPDLQQWDVAVLHFMNWEKPSPGTLARENLRTFVASGKGLMLLHFACGAWQDWPEFKKIAGRVYDPKLRPHDPHGLFRVEMAGLIHPITRGMQSFATTDELYTCLAGDAPIDVVASATSKVDGKAYPMAFVLNYEKGRVFHTVLGHDVRAITNSSVPELLQRGCAWAAGKPVR